jgi:uncharacterized protein (TIGR02453 family)
MAFKGWPDTALAFYEGLEADNSKAYWLDHKEVYERDVKAPMDALLAELTAEFGGTKVFRPYRDTRFSRDKSPYKTAIAATIGSGYVQLSAEGLFAGGGMYHMMPDQLARFRKAIDADTSGQDLEKVVATVAKSGLDVHAPEELKTAPKGYPKDHPRIELLRMKGLVAARSWEPAAWLRTAGAKKRVVETLRAIKPVLSWLEANVGPSTEIEAFR